MDWWQDARFGMFIHWGVYSVFGNVYDGLDVNGDIIHYDMRTSGMPSEWIMYLANIPRSIYSEAANEFDAKDYNPKELVEIAKNAGMKYIVITAKHHDGFCLFETKHTDWNAVNASAARRDLLKDLVKEAKDAGLKIGFYYSQNLDWMQEGGMGNIPELKGGMYLIDQVKTYVDSIVIPQIQELTSNYDIDIFWFDAPDVTNSNTEISQKILDALLNSPVGDKIIYNNRLFTGFDGNFSTPETDTPYIPYNGYPDNRAWEACASLNNSWGFEYEPDVNTPYNINRWKTGYYIVSRILEIASKGGNFLLNVGPDRHGNIPDSAVNTLRDVGEWMKIYGETVYGTEKNSLVHPFEYGYVTQKTENDGSVHWFLHVSPSYWSEGKIVVNGIADLPQSATWFDSKNPVEIQLKDNMLFLTLPKKCPNPYYATIDLHFQQPPKQFSKYPIQNNIVRLTPYQATTYYVSKNFIPYTICGWFYSYSLIEFNVFLEAGVYSLDADYACWYQDGELYFKIGDQNFTANYKNTGNPSIANDINNFVSSNLIEEIIIPESKVYSIVIQRNAGVPDITNWINIRSISFKKKGGDSINNNKNFTYPIFVKDGFLVCESPNKQIIRIYDASGRLRKTSTIEKDNKIDIRMFEPGVYILKGDNFTQKIVF
jgi:alpha-L-fucosidase